MPLHLYLRQCPCLWLMCVCVCLCVKREEVASARGRADFSVAVKSKMSEPHLHPEHLRQSTMALLVTIASSSSNPDLMIPVLIVAVVNWWMDVETDGWTDGCGAREGERKSGSTQSKIVSLPNSPPCVSVYMLIFFFFWRKRRRRRRRRTFHQVDVFQHKKPQLANTRKNYRTCNRPSDTWKTVQKRWRRGVKGGQFGRQSASLWPLLEAVTGYMGEFNAVQSTIRWRAQVRSSKTIKIRQLSMIVSTLRDSYKSFFSSIFYHLVLWYFPLDVQPWSKSNILTESTGDSADGSVSRSVQTTLVRLDVGSSTASSFRYSVFFKLFPSLQSHHMPKK